MKRKVISCIIVGLLICIAPITAFAGTWKEVKYYEGDDVKWQYLKDDGNYARNEWIYDNGSWYFIGEDRYMSTGLVNSNYENTGGYDYYFDESGRILKGGFVQTEYKLYFVDKDGHPVKGLFMVDGSLYLADRENYFMSNITFDRYLGIYNKDYGNKNKKDSYLIKCIYDGGKILDENGKPFAANSKIFTQIKYLPKYDSKGSLIGAIQNPNGYEIK